VNTTAVKQKPIELCIKDYRGNNGYVTYAGVHLILDLWHPKILKIETVRKAFVEAIKACGATLLNIDLHEFTPFGGISGVAVLQESHISIHSWPEYNYAAMDIFVCGSVDPYKAIPVFEKYFRPERLQITEVKRGIMPQ